MIQHEARGIAEMRARIIAWQKRVAEIFGPILHEVALAIMRDAKKLVPEDSGDLKASGRVLPPVHSGGSVSVTLGFGDDKTRDYAVIVHEDLTARHQKGQAKFLEIPYRQRIDNVKTQLLEGWKSCCD